MENKQLITKTYSISPHNKNRLMISFALKDNTGFEAHQKAVIEKIKDGKIIITEKELWDSENE